MGSTSFKDDATFESFQDFQLKVQEGRFDRRKVTGDKQTPVLGNAVTFLGMKLKRGSAYFFQCRPMFSHINGKLSPTPFE